ncbi:hypothetical protein [Streptomyces armeniacus]|uniref:hypothetical protein n=1 Tax=Streptomyces armeniacus TaxID=83291 RepID=UPI001AD80764|nr:hypothetical protein [Streptomyces armeniacus]
MYGGVPTKDLKVQAGDLQTFKTRVDNIITELETSAAGKGKMSEQVIPRTSFGAGGLNEADSLSTQYNRVHTLLTTLSQTLRDQIEAMGIAVQGAKNGFDSLEDDVKRRFWEIQTRAHERYEQQKRDQAALRGEKDAKPAGSDGETEGFSDGE